MQARLIATGERRVAMFGRVTILAAAVLAASCVEPPSQAPMDAGVSDAAPSGFAVRGNAIGVLGPVALELRIDGDTELLAVTQEGTFSFVTRLEAGASYTVVLVNPDVPCTLRNETGVIAGADPVVELTCTGASLASLVVSGIAPAVTLVPGTTEYVIDLPLSQPAVTLTATVAIVGDTIEVAGTPTASGTPSAEIALNLGDNLVDVVVENTLGWQRTYRLTLRRAAQLAQYAYGKASNTDANDYFGDSVALSGDTIVVGAYEEASAAQGVGGNQADNSASSAGAVYVFRRSGSAWLQEAYIKASNTEFGDYFGWSVALSGDTLAIGAPGEDSAAMGVDGNEDDDSASGAGAVYIFRRTGSAWLQEAYVKASNTGTNDQFGYTMALSGDTLAVGAIGEDSAAVGIDGNEGNNSAGDSGAVYVFRRSGSTWLQEAYVKASNTGAGDEFGYSLALSGDILASGTWREDSMAQGVDGNQADNSALDSGAVYVFRRTGSAWLQEAYIKASNTNVGDQFGYSVALSGDTLAVGGKEEDSAAQGVGGNQTDNSAAGSGAVYVFRRSGSAWLQEAYIKASNTGSGDDFGSDVALAGDTLAVAARSEDSVAQGLGGNQEDNGASYSGAVYVFRRSGSAWQQEAYIKASNTDTDDLFGWSVALSGDTLAVGAPFEDSVAKGVDGDQADDSTTDSGAVYVFH